MNKTAVNAQLNLFNDHKYVRPITKTVKQHKDEFALYSSQGVCWSCGRSEDNFGYDLVLEKGHLVDRSMGGADEPSNIRPMCFDCNHILKPFHRTIEECMLWRNRIYKNDEFWQEFYHFKMDNWLKLVKENMALIKELFPVDDHGFPTILERAKETPEQKKLLDEITEKTWTKLRKQFGNTALRW
jgi:hypothetical protein